MTSRCGAKWKVHVIRGSGSCAPGVILANFAGADGRSTAGHVVVLVRV